MVCKQKIYEKRIDYTIYDELIIGLNESTTGFEYAPISTEFLLLSSPTITVGLSSRPSSSLARFG